MSRSFQRGADVQEPASPSLAQAVSFPQLQVYNWTFDQSVLACNVLFQRESYFGAGVGQGTHWTICLKKVLEAALVNIWCKKPPVLLLVTCKLPFWQRLYQIHKKTLF